MRSREERDFLASEPPRAVLEERYPWIGDLGGSIEVAYWDRDEFSWAKDVPQTWIYHGQRSGYVNEHGNFIPETVIWEANDEESLEMLLTLGLGTNHEAALAHLASYARTLVA